MACLSRKLHFLPLALIAGLSITALSRTGYAFADEPKNDNDFVSQFCATGAEGSYVGMDSLHDKTRLNIVCLSPTQIVATVGILTNPKIPSGQIGLNFLSYGIAFKDDDQMILSSFGLAPGDRPGVSSKLSGHYMKVDLNALAQRHLKAIMINPTSAVPVLLNGEKDQDFPNPNGVAGKQFTKDDLIGTYNFDFKGSPAQMWADVILGAPVFTVSINKTYVIEHFIEGPPFNPNGVISSSIPWGDGETDEKSLIVIRGQMLSSSKLDFYWIEPYRGITPVIHATKIARSNILEAMKRIRDYSFFGQFFGQFVGPSF